MSDSKKDLAGYSSFTSSFKTTKALGAEGVSEGACPYCGELMRDDLAETFISGKGVSFNDVCLNFKCKREVWVEIVPMAIVSKVEVVDQLGVEAVEPEGGYKGAKHFYEGVTGDKLKCAQKEARKLLGLNEDGGMADDAKFNFSTKDGHVNIDSDLCDWDKVCAGNADNDNVSENELSSSFKAKRAERAELGGGGSGSNESFSFKASERLKGAEELMDKALDGC